MAVQKKTPLSGWKQHRRHTVMLPSGFEIQMEVPNLPLLVKTGQLPNDLVQQALGTLQSGKLTAEAIAEQSEFYAKLVCASVKEPAVTEDDIIGEDPLPFEDIEMIVEIATRQRDMDAIGRQLGGLHTSKEWRTFRGFAPLDPSVEGV